MLTDSQKQQIRDIHQRIKTALPGYQPRPGQNKLVAEMASIIAGSYHSYDRIGLIEAGTGTGKSLAYLMAAVPMALASKKTLVISTATVALQEQLMYKDVPFFHQHSDLKFHSVLVKGRQRYVCAARLRMLVQQPELGFAATSASSAAQLQQMWQLWQAGQWNGERDSLSVPMSDIDWHNIEASAVHCQRGHRHHQQCPFHKARTDLEEAQVIVTNHALLLADLHNGNSILPAPEDCIYVIDEAHHLADIGRDLLSARALLLFSNDVWQERCEKIYKQLQKLPNDNVIKDALKLLDAVQASLSLLKPIQQHIRQQNSWFTSPPYHRFSHAELPELWQRQADAIATECGKVVQAGEKLLQACTDANADGQLSMTATVTMQHELGLILQKFTQLNDLWMLWSVPHQKRASQARWLSMQEEQIFGEATPLSVSSQLEQLLFAEAHAVLLLSATLTTNNGFDDVKRDLGIQDHPGLRTLKVLSPFDYPKNGTLCIPNISSEPSDESFTAELIRQVPRYLVDHTGNLVLFASYWQMNEVASALRDQGLSLLVQGEASRQSLLELHSSKIQGGQGSILFGTQSFSEGLDLPGPLLTNLIITKLPFAVPTSPLEEALAESIKARGGNPFLQLTVPQAARKFIQACGRLLRSERDSGRIVVLDRRLVTKAYGTALLNALPPFTRQIDH
jgi:ATP-dependent DNA helicase DinG